MLLYEVDNKPKKLSFDLLDRAIYFASEFLGLTNLNWLNVEFETLKKHQYGFCLYDDEEIVITVAKRLSVHDIIVTIFHEMIHVKQYIDGRLEEGSRWMGQVYNCDYNELPWEKEAFELEKLMLEQFGDF
jgi:hypothetical protein